MFTPRLAAAPTLVSSVELPLQLHCSTISKCVDVVVQQNGGSVIISTKILGPRSVFRGGMPPEIASPVVPLYVQAKMD